MSAAALPSMEAGVDPRATLRAMIAVLAVAALAGGAAWWLRTVHWPIQAVRVDGALVHADRQRIKSVLAEHARAGFFGLDLDALRADLRALPWVRDASLRRVWPDALDATVREHEVAARWNQDGLISRRGAVFGPGDATVTGVPALMGPAGHGPAMLERLQGFTEALAPLGLEIAALQQDERRGWRVELDNGVAVRLGRTQDISERLARFVAIWPRALAGQAGAIAAVDMRYPNGFAVEWRDEGEG